jgi:hypothetical protein
VLTNSFIFRNGKYFNAGSVVFLIYVIEYQFRGLPHAHIVIRLSNAPDHKNPAETATWIDENVSAELPVIDTESTAEDIKYASLVANNMIHNCYANQNTCLDKTTHLCRSGYSNMDVIPFTSLTDRGFPVYRRRLQQDLNVVPHNRQVVLDWEGHANVEFAGSTYSVMYFFKYIHKGNKKVKVDLDNTSDVDKGDEITLYIRGRMLCSMECTWRVLGFQTYPASFPSVRLIKAKLPSVVTALQHSEKVCDMHVYLSRPHNLEFRELKFTEFFHDWDYGYSYPQSYKHVNENLPHPAEGLFRLLVPGVVKVVWLYKRAKPEKSIVRMSYLHITAGEVWYLRQLLLAYSAYSFKELLTTIDENNISVVHKSFQHSAIAHGLFVSESEGEMSFKESVKFGSPRELRNLFVMLTLNGFHSLCILDNLTYVHAMSRDFYEDNGHSDELAQIYLMSALHELFRSEDKDPAVYGLPPAVFVNTELEKERLRYSVTQQEVLLLQLQQKTPNTDEQELLFQEIKTRLDLLRDDIDKPPEKLFEIQADNVGNSISQYGVRDRPAVLYFLQGQGGSGKSEFAKKVLAYARSIHLIAKGCSSTGLSCQVCKQCFELDNLQNF